MFNYDNYCGFARFAVFGAVVVGFWFGMMAEMRSNGYGFRGLWLRVCQEWAMAHGMSKADATNMDLNE